MNSLSLGAAGAGPTVRSSGDTVVADGKVCKLPHCEQSVSAGRSQGSSPGHAVLLKVLVQLMGFRRLEEKQVYSNPSTCPGFDKSNQPWKYYIYKNQKSA